jgi:hypothetical protein
VLGSAQLDDLVARQSTRQVERRVVPEPRLGGDVRPRPKQRPGELRVATLGRPVQRGHPVTLRGVDVGSLAQERAHCFPVPLHRGIGDRRLRRRGRPQQQRREERAEHVHLQRLAHAHKGDAEVGIVSGSAPVLSPKVSMSS